MVNILVTGGTGFIGSNLELKLSQDPNNKVTITGTNGEQGFDGPNRRRFPRELTEAHWEDIGELDFLYHQAGINDTTLMDGERMFEANVSASLRIFEKAISQGCKHIVYASSTAVYGNVQAPYKEDGPVDPLNPYAESKKVLDEKATELTEVNPDVTIVGLRYCNVYGPGENHKGKRSSMIYQLAQQMADRNPELFKWGEQKRDHIYVKDVVRANILASKAEESCVVNCGAGGATEFKHLVFLLNKTLGMERDVDYIDNPYEATYQNHTECDMTLAKEKIGFEPKYTIETGIQDYFESGKLLSISQAVNLSIRKNLHFLL